MAEGHNTPALILSMDLNSYISGFVDGEGCFCVSFQPSDASSLWAGRFDRVSRSARTPIELSCFYVIQQKWGCGFIRPDRSDKTLKFEVRNVGNLVAKVLPHFRKFPLMSSKQADFEDSQESAKLVSEGAHLELQGFEQIVRLAMEMNPSGKRKYFGSEMLNSFDQVNV